MLSDFRVPEFLRAPGLSTSTSVCFASGEISTLLGQHTAHFHDERVRKPARPFINSPLKKAVVKSMLIRLSRASHHGPFTPVS